MKRLVATVSAVSVALCPTACENTQSDAKSIGGSTTVEAGTVRKIGGIGPVTGGATVCSISCRNTWEFAVEEINVAGGTSGYPVVMKYDDDEHDVEKSVNAYNELRDWGMQMSLGTPTSGPCIRISNESIQDNLFQLIPYGVAPECIANLNSFAVCFSSAQQGEKSAVYMKSRMGGAKIGILHDASGVYSNGTRDNSTENAKRLSLSIVADEQFTTDNKTDSTIQLQNLRNAEADVVFIPFCYMEAVLVLQQSHTMGYQPTFFGYDAIDSILNVDGFDKSFVEGLMLLTPSLVEAEDAATQHFTSAHCEEYHETPDQFTADVYDGMYAIEAAAEKANITSVMPVPEIDSAVEQITTEIRLQGVTGTITWSAGGASPKEPKAVIIRNDVYQVC